MMGRTVLCYNWIKEKNSLFESGSSKKSRLIGLCDGWG